LLIHGRKRSAETSVSSSTISKIGAMFLLSISPLSIERISKLPVVYHRQ
jgi:hypothetical protein